MRPLSIREAPLAGGCGGSFHRLWMDLTHVQLCITVDVAPYMAR